jgi:hypothetical protein
MRCLLGFGVGACCGVEDKVLQIVVTINYLEKGTGLGRLGHNGISIVATSEIH